MYLSLHLAHLVQIKEQYSSVKILLNSLKYEDKSWEDIRFLNGGFPDGLPRRLYQVSISLALGQQRHSSTLPQIGLATADGVQCGVEQC